MITGAVMYIDIRYFVEYANQRSEKDARYRFMSIEVTKDEYIRIAEQAKEIGGVVNFYDGIDDVKERLVEKITSLDRIYTMDGKERKTPLKKPREIDNIGIELTDRQLAEFNKSYDLREYLSFPDSEVTIYGTDGSNVQLKYSEGRVFIKNSRKPYQSSMTADDFLSLHIF